MNLSEELIVNELRQGKAKAWKHLFDAHYQVMCHVAERYLHDSYMAESVAGDVLFHLYEGRENLRIETSLRSYLVQSVRNKCLDRLKSKRQKYELLMANLTAIDLEKSAFEVPDDRPMGLLLEQELEEKIHHSVQSLPQECRKVFEMSRFEGKKNAEIAIALGISVNTVKYHIKNALRLLHRDLGPYLTVVLALFGWQ